MTQPTVTEQFARRLRRERWLMSAEKDREIENQEIAAALKVEPSTVGRWFDGLSMPREDALAKLAAYFGVTPGWLHYGHEPRQAQKPIKPAKELPPIRQIEMKRLPATEEEAKPAKRAGRKRA